MGSVLNICNHFSFAITQAWLGTTIGAHIKIKSLNQLVYSV